MAPISAKNSNAKCRYITRPAIANERLKRNRAGQLVLRLKSAYRDCTTHIVISPLQFVQHLAALVPRPRLHLIHFHGVLAPNAKLRAAIVPRADSTSDHAAQHAPGALQGLLAKIITRMMSVLILCCEPAS